MTHAKRIYSVLAFVSMLLPPPTARAETLVTHYFEGDVTDSTSSLVAVGERITGNFTYDIDWDDRAPDDPSWFFHLFPAGFSLEEYPAGSPIGMSFTVGSLSHRTSKLFELTVDNDNPDDYLYIGSDNLAPTQPLGGYIDLVDPAALAFSSDRPPAMLDLSTFADTIFSGSDGQGGSFLATLDVLRVVPEPATALVCVPCILIAHLAKRRRRHDKTLAARVELIRRWRSGPTSPWPQMLTVMAGLLTALATAPARAVPLHFQTIALSGQTAPNGSATFWDFKGTHGLSAYLALNDSGQVAFAPRALDRCGGFSCLTPLGIFLGDGPSVIPVAQHGQPRPGGIVQRPGSFVLNSVGQVAFFDSGTSGGIFLGDGGPLTRIAQGSLCCINDVGQVAYSASFPGGIVATFLGDGSRVRQLARTGQAAPDGNGMLGELGYGFFTMSDTGHVAFRSGLTGTANGVADNEGIFLYIDGALTQVARKGAVAPGGNAVLSGFAFSEFSTFVPQVNNLGQVAFVADVTEEGETFSTLFRSDGGVLTQIARSGQQAPDGNGTFAISFGSAFFAPGFGRQGGLLNDAGQMLFEGVLRDETTGAFIEGGLFLGDGGPLTQVVRQGQSAPDGNGVFSTLTGQLNNAGQVLITAQLFGTSGGTADNTGLYLYDNGELTRIVRTGDLFEVGPGDFRTIDKVDISNAPLLPLPLNNFGQTAFPLHFTDGTSGVFLATPVPEPMSVTSIGVGAISLVLWRRRPTSRRL